MRGGAAGAPGAPRAAARAGRPRVTSLPRPRAQELRRHRVGLLLCLLPACLDGPVLPQVQRPLREGLCPLRPLRTPASPRARRRRLPPPPPTVSDGASQHKQLTPAACCRQQLHAIATFSALSVPCVCLSHSHTHKCTHTYDIVSDMHRHPTCTTLCLDMHRHPIINPSCNNKRVQRSPQPPLSQLPLAACAACSSCSRRSRPARMHAPAPPPIKSLQRRRRPAQALRPPRPCCPPNYDTTSRSGSYRHRNCGK